MIKTFARVIAILCLAVPCAFALNPQKESNLKAAIADLDREMAALETKINVLLMPATDKAAKPVPGQEEIAWRIKDLRAQAATLQKLSADYWKNEASVLKALAQWHDEAKAVDEVMVYTPVAQDISDSWKKAKELAMQVQDYAEELPSPGQRQSMGKDFGFAIRKVGRYDKKQVLREYVREFIGGSALDKFPFPDERLTLRPSEVGEVYVVRFQVKPKAGGALAAPLKVRFEYKFASHLHDGVAQETLTGLGGGSRDFVFKNLGDAFVQRGKVLHWRASLLLDEKVVAQKRSPMWHVVSEWAQQ